MRSHHSKCTDCDGTGRDREDGSACPPCEGGGLLSWSWDPEDHGFCEHCGSDGAEVETMECGHDEGGVWICVKCVRLAHEQLCGCVAKGWT